MRAENIKELIGDTDRLLRGASILTDDLGARMYLLKASRNLDELSDILEKSRNGALTMAEHLEELNIYESVKISREVYERWLSSLNRDNKLIKTQGRYFGKPIDFIQVGKCCGAVATLKDRDKLFIKLSDGDTSGLSSKLENYAREVWGID